MDKKKAILLLFLITQLNKPINVNAQETTDEKSDLLKNSFSSDFDFTDNTSMDGVLLAESSDCDCCCDCNCNYCDCQCQCECVAHCDSGTHPKPLYRFYEFVKDAYTLLVNRPTSDGNYKNDFEYNNRVLKSQYKGIQYDIYTPIFNYYDSTNFTYHHINNPMSFNGNFAAVSTPVTTATYDDVLNTLSFYTSKYTKTVTVKIEGDPSSEEFILERHLGTGNEYQEIDKKLTIYDASSGDVITVTDADDKVIINPGDSNTESVGNMIKWNFKFKLRSYGLFEQPDPDSPYQTGKFRITEAKDFVNDVSYKSKNIPAGLPIDIVEKPPLEITFKVRQPKLNNFKIFNVHDIYWKYSFQDPDKNPPIDVKHMPLMTNKDKRCISLGYLVDFSIDSTDFDASQFQKLKIVPSFYKDNQPVHLFYDIPNKNKYNQPLPAECTLIEINKDDNQNYANTGAAKKVVKRDSDKSSTGYEDVKTWKFGYYLPPTTKAYLDSDPSNGKPLTGLLQVKFTITGDIDGATTLNGSKTYDFTGKPQSEGGLTNGSDTVVVFYYNLDWNALDDYRTQQKW